MSFLTMLYESVRLALHILHRTLCMYPAMSACLIKIHANVSQTLYELLIPVPFVLTTFYARYLFV